MLSAIVVARPGGKVVLKLTRRVVVSNYVLPESKHHLEAEITEWEKTMQGKEMHTPIAPTNLEDYESYFDN